MFAEAIEVILQDQCTPTAVRAIEAGGATSAVTATLWQTLENAGFLQLLAAEWTTDVKDWAVYERVWRGKQPQ